MKIEAIIFDLGGVLINLDFKKTTNEFEKIGVQNFDLLFTQLVAHPILKKLETNDANDKEFVELVQSIATIKPSDNDIKFAWNAMLGSFRPKSIEYIKELKANKNLKIFLLSNTNLIHQKAFEKIFEQQFPDNNWFALFDKIYYSHEIKLRKPNINCYEYVGNDIEIKPENCLFIDDTLPNIEAAEIFGWQTHCLLSSELIEKIVPAILQKIN